mgnify:FL=1|jgi:hypothetical protein
MNDVANGHRYRESVLKPKGRDYSKESGTRDCLQCFKPFNSSWYGNRICKQCKYTDIYSDSSEHDI